MFQSTMRSRLFPLCLCIAALLPPAAQAQDAAKVNAEIIKKTIESRFEGVKVERVAKTPYGGLYEVQIGGGDIVYADEKANFLLTGSIIDTRTRENVTEERKRKLSAIKFDSLPLNLAMKQVRGNGKRVVATFEDPNCGFCKKLHQDIARMTDVTIYTFLYPILQADSNDKAKAIWCATDRVKTWNDWMQNGVTPPPAKDCDAPMEKVVELGQKLRVSGTPTMFFPTGERVPGAVPADRFEQLLNETNKK